MKMKLTFPKVKKGGPGSGDFGHTGRPGQIGGSSGGGGGTDAKRQREREDWKRREEEQRAGALGKDVKKLLTSSDYVPSTSKKNGTISAKQLDSAWKKYTRDVNKFNVHGWALPKDVQGRKSKYFDDQLSILNDLEYHVMQ